MRIAREKGQILIIKNSQKFSCLPPPHYSIILGRESINYDRNDLINVILRRLSFKNFTKLIF